MSEESKCDGGSCLSRYQAVYNGNRFKCECGNEWENGPAGWIPKAASFMSQHAGALTVEQVERFKQALANKANIDSAQNATAMQQAGQRSEEAWQKMGKVNAELCADVERLRHELAEARGNVFKNAEVARLRKELEQAMADYATARANAIPAFNPIPVDAAEAYEATIAKLRSFSEDQARQVAELEEGIAYERNKANKFYVDLKETDARVGRLTRENDKFRAERARRDSR